MKWLFSLLLVANLGMFIWLLPQQEGAASNRSWPAEVGQLRLMDEPLAQEQATEEEPPAVPPIQTVAEAEVEQPESPQLPPVVTNDEPEREETAPSEVSESSSELICATIGAFDKRSQAELLSVRVLAQGVKTEITSQSSNSQAGFWVLIPPQPDRAAAVKVAEDLEKAGVADIWRFTSGSLAHAISLGLFRDEERAKARRDKIAAMGFEPVVKPRYREQTLYWLKYQYTGDSPLTETAWQELSEENPTLELNESPCP